MQLLVLFCWLQMSASKNRAPIEIIPSCFPGGVQPAVAPAPVSALAEPVDDSVIDVAFFDTRARPDTSSMMRAAGRCNSSSARVRFHAILTAPKPLPGFRIVLLNLPQRAKCLYDGMKRLSHGPGPQYLYKPLLHYVMPANVRRLILLDTDIVMVRDIVDLHAEFSRFGTKLLGVGNEQSRLYGSNGEGKNGGVQLFDLAKMRASTRYAALLDHHATGRDGRRIGYLGDQTLYSYIFTKHPDMFYTLPCEWNRQISMHFGFHNATVHACPRRCGILHANFAPFKCIAWAMQRDPSCSSWKKLADSLTEPLAPNHMCPRAALPTRRGFKPALTRFFSDCCVPDAATADALGSRTLEQAAEAKSRALEAAMPRKKNAPFLKGVGEDARARGLSEWGVAQRSRAA